MKKMIEKIGTAVRTCASDCTEWAEEHRGEAEIYKRISPFKSSVHKLYAAWLDLNAAVLRIVADVMGG